MLNKKDICVIIGCYPQNHVDSTLVSLTLEGFKRQGYDICLTSHIPLSNELQKASKYYIYSDENYTLNFPKPSSITIFFASEELHYQTNWGNRMGIHSLAILMNMKNALSLLQSKKYKNFIYVECDTILNSNDHNLLESKLKEISFSEKNYWFMIENSNNMVVPVTTIFGGNIDYFNNIFNLINTEEEYLNICNQVGAYSLEALFSALFCNVIDEKGYLDYTKPRDIFSSKWLGISNYGTVSIPELDDEFDVDIDIVKEKGNTENHIFCVLFFNKKEEPINIKFYKDNNLVSDLEIITGALNYWVYEIDNTKNWKVEVYHNNKLLKIVNRTIDEILWNGWSYFENKTWNLK